ncbi:hypothetical protein CGZ93_15085 [Enemella dayhoffiae]|uniref:Uncharacterized protein n=2 Tax=Enemella dayhoffiae TaxID=2016507 RepID=A0A255GR66_9ACTN|nr:hypothetical protein CGZ93_15085 [Enemella dayhoffiae]
MGLPPKKKGGVGKVIGIIVGVVVLLFAGLVIIGLTVGDQDPTAEPTARGTTTPTAAKTAADKPGSRDFKQLKEGDCLRIIPKPGATPKPDGSMEINHEEAGCESRGGGVIYSVGSVSKGQLQCSNDNYIEYYQTSSNAETAAPEDRRYTACLMPRFAKDTCYGEDSKTGGFVASACDPKAILKVVDVIEADDPSKCKGSTAMNFPKPARTYCVVKP